MSLDSPFADKLRKNYLPSPEEESRIRDVIEQQCATVCELDSKLVAIDKAIAHLEAQRKETIQRRDTHQAFADGHRTLLSSILRLSPDILSGIFTDLVPLYDDWAMQAGTPPHPIVAISHVCRQFRTIALSTPMLWTRVSICELPVPDHFDAITLQSKRNRVVLITDMVSTFIRRAGTCPMVLHLGASDHVFPFDLPEYTTAIMPFVSALSQAQWKTLDIFLQLSQPGSPLLQLLKVPQRSSNTLLGARILLHSFTPTVAMQIPDHLDLKNAAQLTSLGLGITGVNLINAKICWERLTDLSLHVGVSHPNVVGVLSKSPNLIKCALELSTTRAPTFTPPDNFFGSIHLTNLQSLTITGFQSIYLPQFFTLPALDILALVDKMDMYTAYSGQPPLDHALPEWIRLHGAQLTHLTFSYGRITLPVLLSCLQGAPNLVSVGILPAFMSRIAPIPGFPAPIGDGRVANFPLPALLALTAWFDEAGERLTQPLSCPKLENVTIFGPDFAMPVEHWVDFISSRRHEASAGVGYLKSLDVLFQALDAFADLHANTLIMRIHNSLRERGVNVKGIRFRTHRAQLKVA